MDQTKNEDSISALAARFDQRSVPVTDELVTRYHDTRVMIHHSCRYRKERHHLKAHKAADGRWYVVKGHCRHYLTECVISKIDGKELLFAFKTDRPRW